MKREILFRGKRIDDGEWVYGDYFNTEKSEFCKFKPTIIENGGSDRDDFHLVDKNSIGQFTGLLDKKGKKIFEDDIVRWDDNSNGEKWRVAVVEINPDLQFRIIRIECDFIQSAQEGYIFKFGRFIYTDTHNHLEIIGNIHDDAKL